jgi:SfnB family sulfur acquisition oxidoreductase
MSAATTAVGGARVIADDAEAIAAAHELAAWLAPGASDRDRAGAVPWEALGKLGRSGLLALGVPRAYGGAEVSYETLAEVFRILAAADPALAQVPQNHYVFVDAIRLDGTEEQKARFFAEVLAGARFGNALSERGTKNVFDLRTRLTADGEGGFRLNGRKYYTTGALSAQWIPVFALDDDDRLVIAYVERGTPGLESLEDWTAMGQRATVSGTTILDDVRVPAENVVPHWRTYEAPQLFGAIGQLIHAAIDVGIARNALEDAAAFVRDRSRPWFESGLERASDEPVVIHTFGQLVTRLHAAEALLVRAGRTVDAAARDGVTAASAAAASLAVAEAKAFGGDVAVEVASELFALAGTAATDERYNLHRHWRNARTHTLHDPNRWKYHHAGNHLLNGVLPPNHGLL